jgi:hypothetical protein
MSYGWKFIVIRLFVIILAIATGIVFVNYVISPYVLEPTCLLNTASCVRIGYYNYKNSVLVHMRNTGIWIWYNGFKAFVFGQIVGEICKEKDKYSPAYAINTDTGLKEGYECVTPLETLIDYYKKRGDMKFIFLRVRDRENFDVFGVLNLLRNKKIISF